METTFIQKQIADSYYIKHPSCGWAVFMISETGDFMVNSDFGTSTFAWRHSGGKGLSEIKQFLTELNEDYWKGKLEYNLNYMGCKKSQIKNFLNHIWPAFEYLQGQLKIELQNK